jgi:hypothetical protein
VRETNNSRKGAKLAKNRADQALGQIAQSASEPERKNVEAIGDLHEHLPHLGQFEVNDNRPRTTLTDRFRARSSRVPYTRKPIDGPLVPP